MYQKEQGFFELLDIPSSNGYKYIWYAPSGYAIGLVTALGAGILTLTPQPTLLYLENGGMLGNLRNRVIDFEACYKCERRFFDLNVPSTLGPAIVISWMRKELTKLWEGTTPNINEKANLTEV
ncbi:unnamed protein product [Ilex paraguariensis]|uniref:Uncharacterized protein n=1 Tax=Ilex paraguariensis TaxID=185542 RepID=A0ABC8USP2_9AQUA